jgi:hypothetical protein
MKHIAEDLFYTYVFDQYALTEAEAMHLAQCAECQAKLATVRCIKGELKLAQQSTPTAQALARYAQLFAQVQQQPGLLTRMVQRLRAQLTWDSRQQPALQGVRNAAVTHYRQLYTTDQVEVELMVTSQQRHLFDVEGDLLNQPDQMNIAPAFVQLQHVDGQTPTYEVESDANGRFHVGNVAPGRYQLVITRPEGALIEITDLEIS